jgi:flagellar biosynthesis/type III secretory pathway protein FliH
VPEELLLNEDISQALDLCEKGAFTDDELEIYDRYWDAVSVEKSLLGGSYAEGRAEGEALGMQKGRAEGNSQKSKDIALQMLNDREPVEKIMRYTGLTEEQIQAIIHNPQ